MEPSFRVITIDKEIKFKKSDLESLKDSKEYDSIESGDYRICSISNVQYFLKFYPNGDEDDCLGQTWLFLHVELGNATKVQTDVDISIDSVGFSTKIKEEYVDLNGWGEQICTTEELFDSKKKFFIIDEMIIKVKGTMKIYLPTNTTVYPFSGQWKIKEADLDTLKTSTDDDTNRLWSKRFTLSSDSDTEYYLGFCPNGNDEESRGKALLSLHLELGSAKKLKAVYNAFCEKVKHLRSKKAQEQKF